MASLSAYSSAVPTGDWQSDCSAGREIGRMTVEECAAGANPLPLGALVQAMVERGAWSGIEVGVCAAIGMRCR